MSWVNVAIGGMQAANQVNQGRTARALGGLQQQANEFSAGVEEQSALQTARLIRRAGDKLTSAQTAAYAAVGVKVGEGSAGELERRTNLDVEHDAFQALLEGSRRARGLRVSGAAANGRAAAAAGWVAAAGTVLGSGWSALRNSGWNQNGPGFSGGQAPAPVETRSIPRY